MDHAQKTGLFGTLAGLSGVALVGLVLATIPDVSTVLGGLLLVVSLLLPVAAIARGITA